MGNGFVLGGLAHLSCRLNEGGLQERSQWRHTKTRNLRGSARSLPSTAKAPVPRVAASVLIIALGTAGRSEQLRAEK